MSTDLAVIEAALKAATPGPWETWPHTHLEDGCRCLSCHFVTVWQTRNGIDCEDIARKPGESERCDAAGYSWEDANLIANAPAWLAELVERVKVAEAAIERVRRFANDAKRDYAHISGCGGDPECPACWAHDILRALDGDAKRCTSDITLRDEEHRLCRCTLTEGHAGVHDDGAGTTWTGGDA